MKQSERHGSKKLLAGLLVAVALAAAACSSSEGPSTIEPEPTAPTAEVAPATSEPQSVAVPVGIPALPLIDPANTFPQPTAEDALFDFLFLTLNQAGYTLVSSCAGLSLEANPNIICSVESSTEVNGQIMTLFEVGEPPPGISWYAVFVMEVPGQGWQVNAASEILRVTGA